MRDFHPQSGSALFIILIAIVAFAGLSYAVFKGGSTSVSKAQDDKVRMAAMDILAYSDTLAKAVQTLKLRGCGDLQYDFTNNQWKQVDGDPAMIGNANAPSDGSCAVFGPAGGMTAVIMPDAYMYPDASSYLIASNVKPGSSVVRRADIPGLKSGTDEDIYYLLPRVSVEVCMKINEILNVQNGPNRPPVAVRDDGSYVGMLNTVRAFIDTENAITGKSRFCIMENSSAPYSTNFVQVLVIR